MGLYEKIKNPDAHIGVKKMSKWSEYYNKEIENLGGNSLFIKHKKKEKKELIKRIKKYTNNTCLEAGCGTGAISTSMALEGYKVTSIDSDKEMIKIAEKISSGFKKKPNFVIENINNLNYNVDVVFNHGVMEHFNNKEIIKLINVFLLSAKTFVFSVPSSILSEDDKIYGDERFLNKKQWKKIIAQTNGICVESFGYFYQKKLRWLNFLPQKILIKHTPYIGFVIKKNH